jgi:hypothetical protein
MIMTEVNVAGLAAQLQKSLDAMVTKVAEDAFAAGVEAERKRQSAGPNIGPRTQNLDTEPAGADGQWRPIRPEDEPPGTADYVAQPKARRTVETLADGSERQAIDWRNEMLVQLAQLRERMLALSTQVDNLDERETGHWEQLWTRVFGRLPQEGVSGEGEAGTN